ncbi:MAG: hypothetical protein ABIP37_07065 [Methylotenera sp.]
MSHYNLHLIEIVVVIILLVSLVAGGIRHAEKLKTSEQLWKFALEGAGDGVWDWDIENDMAHFNTLSNLPNLTLLNNRLKLTLAYAKREKNCSPSCL